jgi:hypothetical protein
MAESLPYILNTGTLKKALERTHCGTRIRDIVDYACYRRIIERCRIAADALDCELIEVEQLWAGTEFIFRAPPET